MTARVSPPSTFRIALLHLAIICIPCIIVAAYMRPSDSLLFPIVAILPIAFALEPLLPARAADAAFLLAPGCVAVAVGVLVAFDLRQRSWWPKAFSIVLGLAMAALMPAAMGRLS